MNLFISKKGKFSFSCRNTSLFKSGKLGLGISCWVDWKTGSVLIESSNNSLCSRLSFSTIIEPSNELTSTLLIVASSFGSTAGLSSSSFILFESVFKFRIEKSTKRLRSLFSYFENLNQIEYYYISFTKQKFDYPKSLNFSPPKNCLFLLKFAKL